MTLHTTSTAGHKSSARSGAFDVDAIRRDFPILARQVHGKPLVYLDSAATAQKPESVIEAEANYYRQNNSNVHRGVHQLSNEATDAFEHTREALARLINARDAKEVIFTRGATEAINLVAASYGGSVLKPGDDVLITHMEHHSNIVPWQLICEKTGAKLKVVPVNDRGELELDAMKQLLNERTKIVSVVHISNTLGTINPISEIARLVHGAGAVLMVDGAQGLQHLPVNVQELDCDFYTSTGHKMFGPTGTGFLWGREKLLDAMPPYHGGGAMIRSVTFEKTTYADLPAKFEAGTPNIGGIVGLGAAIEYMIRLDREAAMSHEHDLLEYATNALGEFEQVRIIGTAAHKASTVSFVIDGIHPHDIGTILDHEGVAVRTGHHCTQPLMARFKIPATTRASMALYNTRADIDSLVRGLRSVIEVFHP